MAIKEPSQLDIENTAKEIAKKEKISFKEAARKASERLNSVRKESMPSFGDAMKGQKIGDLKAAKQAGDLARPLIPGKGIQKLPNVARSFPSLLMADKTKAAGAMAVPIVAGMIANHWSGGDGTPGLTGQVDQNVGKDLGVNKSIFDMARKRIDKKEESGAVGGKAEESSLFQKVKGQIDKSEKAGDVGEASLFDRVKNQYKKSQESGNVTEKSPSYFDDEKPNEEKAPVEPAPALALPVEDKEVKADDIKPMEGESSIEKETEDKAKYKAPEDVKANHLLAALLTILPTGLGGILGGTRGALAGATAGNQGIQKYYGDVEDKNKSNRDLASKNYEREYSQQKDDKDYEMQKQYKDMQGKAIEANIANQDKRFIQDQQKLEADLERMGMDRKKIDAEIDNLKVRQEIDRERIRADLAGKMVDTKNKRAEVKEEKETKFLAQNLKSIATANQVKNELDKALGFDLNAYDPKTGTVNGKSVDLPGFSFPGIGRVSAYTGEARGIDSIIEGLKGVRLKDQSGATVTPQELQRFLTSVSQGRFNTEEEYIGGIQRVIRGIQEEARQIEAGVAPSSLETFKERGGTIAIDPSVPQEPQMIVDPDSKQQYIKVPGGWRLAK